MAGLLAAAGLSAQPDGLHQATALFRSDELLELDLRADFDAIMAVRADSTLFPAEITVTDDSGVEKTIEIKVRTRGKTRNDNTICKFAPLRLEFPKRETDGTPFEGQKALKLVTHCDDPGHYEQNTIAEYLVYKAYNALTDSSFKVRPAMINYISTSPGGDTIRRFAFFIEREKHLAERLGLVELETDKVHPDRLEPYQTCLVDIFEYMIGNTDYSVYELHNIVLVSAPAAGSPLFPVPYDFDWSGLVSAKYAVPSPVVGTDYVTQRVYRGLKKDPRIIDRTLSLFISKKQDIYRVFEEFPLMDQKEKNKVARYLDDFYSIIGNERKVKYEFIDNARTIPD